jgi:hypothetical protein
VSNGLSTEALAKVEACAKEAMSPESPAAYPDEDLST